MRQFIHLPLDRRIDHTFLREYQRMMRSLKVEIFLIGWLGGLGEDELGIVIIDQLVSIVIDPIPIGMLLSGYGRQALHLIPFLPFLPLKLNVYQLSLMAILLLLFPHQLIELLSEFFLF